MGRGDEYFLKIFQAVSFLQIDEFKKRLIAGLAIKMMKTPISELKEQYGLQEYEIKDE